MSKEYILYGGELSLYTGKARAYMRYKDLDFEERLATKEVYKTIILPKVGAPIVPVLQLPNGDCIQDTTDIIDCLEVRHPRSSIYPDTPVQKLVAMLLELYGDEWLVIPAMHYRWSVLDQQYDFIMSEFGRMSAPEATHDEQIAIGEKTSRPFRGSIFALGITPETIPAIEQAYADLLAQLDNHFLTYDFLLGSRPSIGDFGLMGPLYAHLGRDPVPRALMQETAPHVYAWVQRMNAPVPLAGDFLPDDEIPETLLPVLRTLCSDQLPDVLDVIAHNAAFVDGHPEASIPRVLGMHSFTTGGVTGQRFVSSYAQWMFQRPLQYYQALDGEALSRADELLRAVGGYESMQVKLPYVLRRKSGQLELVVASV